MCFLFFIVEHNISEKKRIERMNLCINELFTQMTKENPAKGTVNQKIADLYKLGLDSVRLNKACPSTRRNNSLRSCP